MLKVKFIHCFFVIFLDLVFKQLFYATNLIKVKKFLLWLVGTQKALNFIKVNHLSNLK